MNATETVKIKHTVELVTEFDAKNSTVHRFLALPEEMQQVLLAETFKAIATTEGWLDDANKNNSYALLRFAEDGE
jgi:hypothetical protein